MMQTGYWNHLFVKPGPEEALCSNLLKQLELCDQTRQEPLASTLFQVADIIRQVATPFRNPFRATFLTSVSAISGPSTRPFERNAVTLRSILGK